MIDFLASDMYEIIIGINAIGLAIALRKEDLCPICKNELGFIFRGFPRKEDTNKLRDNNIKFVLGGCICYGDKNKDSEYFCNHCKKEFKYNFEEIDKKYYTMY